MSNLPQKYARVFGFIFPLVDTLQMKLMFYVRHQGKKELIGMEGEQKIELPVTDGFTLDMNCKVYASHVSTRESWVLVHVKGSLWVLVMYEQKEEKIYFWLIDGSLVGLKESNAGKYSGSSSPYMSAMLKKGRVLIAVRPRNEDAWKITTVWRVADARGVDEGSARETEEKLRDTTQEGSDST